MKFIAIRIRSDCEPKTLLMKQREKPLRAEPGSCEFNSRDPDKTFIDCGIPGKPCEPNLRIEAVVICDLRFGALSPELIMFQFGMGGPGVVLPHLPVGKNCEFLSCMTCLKLTKADES